MSLLQSSHAGLPTGIGNRTKLKVGLLQLKMSVSATSSTAFLVLPLHSIFVLSVLHFCLLNFMAEYVVFLFPIWGGGGPEGRWFDPSWSHWNFSLTQNPSDRTMALGSTQPLTEMSTRNISSW